MANSSKKDRLVVAIAKPIAHPGRYRKHIRIAGGTILVAAAVYLLFGTTVLIGLAVIGGVVSRYMLKTKRNWRKSLPG